MPTDSDIIAQFESEWQTRRKTVSKNIYNPLLKILKSFFRQKEILL